MNKDELNEIGTKMNFMDEMLKKNVFNNPLMEVQSNIRNELIDFRTTLLRNFIELDNYVV